MNFRFGKIFLVTALVMLLIALSAGLLSAMMYIFPNFLKESMGFVSLRPFHVSSALFWIILGASGCIYSALSQMDTRTPSLKITFMQWLLWLIAICGIFYAYTAKKFGGREYWEFEPIWALPIAIAWILFLFNFILIIRRMKDWPVYIWMWLTGIVFFLFTFIENYLWLFPYFREHVITDMTIQWKVNGSLVGAWNQILYGTAFFMMDKISGKSEAGRSKLAFTMYFLGLTNLMFNWGHHIYTLPTEKYIRYFGYVVSMTEWIFLLKIIYNWKRDLTTIQKHYHFFPYRFIMAADIWVFINLFQALLMSIPALNLISHGTHITVAHAMGTTIGINSMILLAACFMFFNWKPSTSTLTDNFLNTVFWLTQFALLVFWLSLILAGIKKGCWQLDAHQSSYSKLMDSLTPYFMSMVISGSILWLCLSMLVLYLLNYVKRSKNSV